MAILVLSVKGQKIVLKNAENPWFLKGFRGEVLKWDLIMEAPPRFELGDQSFAVSFRGALIVDIEPFLGVRQLKNSEKVGKYAT